MVEIMHRWAFRMAVVVGAMAGAAPSAFAQGGDGYLFREPRVRLKFESGYGFQRAQSDLFDYTIDRFTVDRRDFDSPYLGGELAIRLADDWDVAFSLGLQSSTIDSEDRDFIGTDDLPITQVTRFRQIPAVASVKLYPLGRGQSLGRFVWIPRSVSPFVGLGGGVVSYRFEQDGEFVNEETLDIFVDRIRSQRSGPLARAAAGLDVSVGKQFFATFEGRYTWASAEVAGGFDDFNRLDLDGLQVVGGIGIRF